MFARTERLTLRPGWPEDAAELATAIGHEKLVRRLARVPWPYSAEDARVWLTAPYAASELRLVILDSIGTAPRIVGGIGLHAEPDGMALGYWLTPAVWGRGYATEAGRAVIDTARRALPLDRLVSSYHIDNPASGAVLRKLGFRGRGTTRMQYSVAQGCEVETALVELDLSDGTRSVGTHAIGAPSVGTMPIAA